MRVRFWGTRGSIATPGPTTVRFGGNTCCVEVVTDAGQRFILDCGTGLRMLGNKMRTAVNGWSEAGGQGGVDAHVLVTHYHWDHIQGIPFFHPFFEARNRFHFYGFQSKYLGRDTLRQVLESQMASPYFPVDISMMTAARIMPV